MNNPLVYFENLLSSDQAEAKKKDWIYDTKTNWGGYIVDTNEELGSIEQYSWDFDEDTKEFTYIPNSVTFFQDVFESEIKKELNNSKQIILTEILKISSAGITPQNYLNQLIARMTILQYKSSSLYLDYSFVKENVTALKSFIQENLDSSGSSIEISSKNTLATPIEQVIFPIPAITNYATPVITNYSSLSFKWDLMNPEDVETELSRLYELLTANPPLIDCDKQDFINGFSQREVVAGINWMVMAKNKTCSKSSLFYLLSQLIEKSDLMDEPDDFNKKVEYVFRNNEGEKLSNIKQSKSQSSDNPAQKERIDEIIESFLQV